MRIIGIDCGTERTGFGVVETDGSLHYFVSAGVIRTKSTDALEQRLFQIARELRAALAASTPEVVAVEEVFHAVNAKSALKLAHVRGVALLVAAEAGLPVAEYSALEVKMSVVGYGGAEKNQVHMMVRSLLRLDRGSDSHFGSYDASDALAVAICHATRAAHPATAGRI